MIDIITLFYNDIIMGSSSALLNLQTLENEFGLTMKQYEQAYANYISTLQSQGALNSKNNYSSLNGRTFWGAAGLKEGAVNSEDECWALCSSDSACSGATYNSAKAYCWTRSGNGAISVGSSTDNALISQLTQNMYNLQTLNNKLLKLNNEIILAQQNIASSQKPLQENNMNNKYNLQTVYEELLLDRENIEAMMQEYKTMDEKYDNTYIYVKQTNSVFILWCIFSGVFLFYTIKTLINPGFNVLHFRVIFWICIFSLFAIVSTHLNSTPGFLLWGLIIAMVALMQMKIIPKP